MTTTATPLVPPLARRLFALAREIGDFANEATERLSFDDYATLTELEAKLLAFANLLSVTDREAFLAEELSEAAEMLQWLRDRTGDGSADDSS
jgi:uncharacterized membrane protein